MTIAYVLSAANNMDMIANYVYLIGWVTNNMLTVITYVLSVKDRQGMIVNYVFLIVRATNHLRIVIANVPWVVITDMLAILVMLVNTVLGL